MGRKIDIIIYDYPAVVRYLGIIRTSAFIYMVDLRMISIFMIEAETASAGMLC